MRVDSDKYFRGRSEQVAYLSGKHLPMAMFIWFLDGMVQRRIMMDFFID
jgi:hypothetical protein